MTQPWGLSSLPDGDRARVDSANAIYRQCADFCSWILTCQPATGFTVENPLHSWLWHLPPFQALLQKCVLVSFDACLHGSRRNKATALLTNVEGVGELSGPCPGCTSHEPWGRTTDGYATSAEAAYPRLLCDRILQCVDVFAAATDAAPTPQAVTPLAEARAAAQKQPRGRRFAPIISEFSHTVSVQASASLLSGTRCPQVPSCCVFQSRGEVRTPEQACHNILKRLTHRNRPRDSLSLAFTAHQRLSFAKPVC